MLPNRKPSIVLIVPCLFSLFLIQRSSFAQQTAIESGWWSPNREVSSLEETSDKVLLGGSFSQLGVNGKGLIRYQYPDTVPIFDNWYTNGVVRTIISDGNGGIYIGGSFTKVGLSSRSRIARIKADGSLHPWSASFDSVVNVLRIVNGQLYVGGYFNQCNGQTRNYLAVLDTANGNLLPFNPNPNWLVHDFEIWNNQLIVAGGFTEIGGQTRNRLAAFNLGNGTLAPLNQNINNEVLTLKVDGNKLYVGGMFNNIGANSRNRMAAINLTNNQLENLQINCNDFVYDIETSSSRIFIGGSFDTVNNHRHPAFVVIDKNNSQIISQDIYRFQTIKSITKKSNSLVLAGDITKITVDSITLNTIYKRVIATELDVSTLQELNWNTGLIENINEPFRTISCYADVNGYCYFGGDFKLSGSQYSFNFSSIKYFSKKMTGFHLNFFSPTHVDKFAFIYNNEAYMYDAYFSHTSRVFDINTGLLIYPSRFGYEEYYSGTLIGTSLFVGGSFTLISSLPRNRLAALDTATGAPTNWGPNVNGTVTVVKPYNSSLVFGGSFTSVNNQSRSNLAMVNTLSGSLGSLNIGINGNVKDILIVDTILYVIGNFTQVGGQPRQHFAAINLMNQSILPLSFSFSNSSSSYNTIRLNSIAVRNNYLFLGGKFDSLNGVFCRGIGVFDLSNQQLINVGLQLDLHYPPLPYNNSPQVNDLMIKGDKLFIGGNFEFIGDQYRPNFAVVSMPSILGIDEIENEAMTTIRTVDIYPNPANDQLFISIPAAGLWQTEIISLNGQVVDKLLLSQGTHSLPLNLDQGLYLIRFTDGKSTETRKLMINK
jgi:trimeric autotransporter adhesin